jgi:hypothetical protein
MEGTQKWETNFKRVAVKMSDGSLLNGKINIRNFDRVRDFFKNVQDQYIVLINNEGQPERTIILKNSYIVWVEAQE